MKLSTMKLHKFKSYNKFIEFINHLESIPSIVNFVVLGGAILLEFESQNVDLVYYYTTIDSIKNLPIVAVDCDCDVDTNITDYDINQLELKRLVNNQGWI
jgi:hypothetical protein